MPVASDAQSLTIAAEQAASAGDYAAAEQSLRLAVELQEAKAGPKDPDLANTLNNLGVVCEQLGKAVDAEQCYRRAHAIASEVLDADHPFVALSAKNLRDFCQARGIPLEPPAAAVPATPPVSAHEPEPQFSSPSSTQTPAKGTSGRLAIGAVGLLLLIAAALVITRTRSTGPAAPTVQRVPPPAPAAAAIELPASSPTPAPPPAARPPLAATAASPAPSVAPPVKSAGGAPTVLSADLCRTLDRRAGEWQCASASGSLAPGTLFFYTRVASKTNTTIEHRWYRNDRLHQAISLRVHANERSGYRTYSRMTVRADRAGDWRVELRTSDGTILREERFTVRP